MYESEIVHDVRMYVCMYVCMKLCIVWNIHVCMNAYFRVFDVKYMYIYVCMYACMKLGI